jgi:hypothetical protein
MQLQLTMDYNLHLTSNLCRLGVELDAFFQRRTYEHLDACGHTDRGDQDPL